MTGVLIVGWLLMSLCAQMAWRRSRRWRTAAIAERGRAERLVEHAKRWEEIAQRRDQMIDEQRAIATSWEASASVWRSVSFQAAIARDLRGPVPTERCLH